MSTTPHGPETRPPGIADIAASGLLAGGPQEGRILAAGDEEASRRMESLFLTILIKEMRETLPGDGLFGGLAGSSIFESMFDRALADSMAQRGVGLQGSILESIGAARAASPEAPGGADTGEGPLPLSGRGTDPQPFPLQGAGAPSEKDEVSDSPTLRPTGPGNGRPR